MPDNKNVERIRAEVIKIVAARKSTDIIEYEVRDFAEPGSVPNWFLGVILLLRDEIQEDEKIVVQNRIIKIVKKTAMDKFLDWVRGLRSLPGIDAEHGMENHVENIDRDPDKAGEDGAKGIHRYNH